MGMDRLRFCQCVVVLHMLFPGVLVYIAEMATAYRAPPGCGLGDNQDSAGLLRGIPRAL